MPAIINTTAKSQSILNIKLTAEQSRIETFGEFNFTPSKGINWNWLPLAESLAIHQDDLRHSPIREAITKTNFIELSQYNELCDADLEVEKQKMKDFYLANKEKFVSCFNNQIGFLGVKKEGSKFGIVTVNIPKLEAFKGQKVIETVNKKTSK